MHHLEFLSTGEVVESQVNAKVKREFFGSGMGLLRAQLTSGGLVAPG